MRKLKNRKKIKRINYNNFFSNNYYSFLGGFWGILFYCLGLFIYEGYVFYQCNLENDRLISLKTEYAQLSDDIENYKTLKGQYEIILKDSNNLNSNKSDIQKKINSLNNDIKNLESKIVDINKKIKSLS